MQLPLGIRQNNPGNIEKNPANKWQGLVEAPGRFCTFVSPEFGIRAIVRILRRYLERDKDGELTIMEIIKQWAPPVENNTKSYAQFVADSTGKGIEDPINIFDANELAAVIKAKIRMENDDPNKWGRTVWYDDETIMRGVQMGMTN